MRKMTEQNVAAALAGESQAHLRYLAFAETAEKSGKPELARLFRAVSYSEQMHALNHLRALGQVGTDAENLQASIGGEDFEVQEMYPAYLAVAKEENEPQAQRSLGAALAAEKVHSKLYGEALKAIEAGGDTSATKLHVCSVCGFTVEGEAPEHCPVCGAPKKAFHDF